MRGMNNSKYKPKDLIFSLDIGTRSIIGSVGIIKNNKFVVLCEEYKEHEERAMVDGQIHDIDLVAKTVRYVKESIEEKMNVELKEVSIAAAGRFLRTSEASIDIELSGDEEINKDIIRGLELSAVKKAEGEIIKNSNGKMYCVGYSVKNYYLNSFVISNLLGHKGEKIGADVIATFLPRSVVDSLYAVMEKVSLTVMNLTLEPIAAIEAVVPQKLRLLNIALVDIGAGTSDIAISSKQTVAAYGMVPLAGDEVTEVIAQEYLIDFNEAEVIKREITQIDEIKYTDVLGVENVVKSEEALKLIKPTVRKIAEEIGGKIIELNGDKSPAAVFLVGGGAHTPYIMEELSDVLNIKQERIGIKDRSAIEECECDNRLGSAGVTVIGIALNAIRKIGDNFVDIDLNGEIISLFNSRNNTVLDVLIQAGINSSFLIARNGKSKRFILNGKKRLVFGQMGTNAEIFVNGEKADTDTEVFNGDKIVINYARNGEDAKTTVREHVGNITSISIYIDDEINNIDPLCTINGELKDFNSEINEDDEVNIFLPNTVKDIREKILQEDVILMKNDMKLSDDYVVTEGEKIYRRNVQDEVMEEDKDEKKTIDLPIENKELSKGKVTKESGHSITVIVNGEPVVLTGKDQYVFVDIFDKIDFDIHTVQGRRLNTTLNGNRVAYLDNIKENDVINVEWVN